MREDLLPIPDGALLEPSAGVIHTDILIIGSGMGGGTAAWALKDTGRDVLIVERGTFLPREPQNSQPDEVFVSGRYKTATPWIDGATGTSFQPGAYADYPGLALEHEPVIARLAGRLRARGLKPFHMPNGMNLDTLEDRRRATANDGSPSEDGTKSDAENRAIRPALQSGSVKLLTDTVVEKLITDTTGKRIIAAETTGGLARRVEANQFVLAAGAVNSAVLLLNSSSAAHPDDLGNSSGLLGRNYMQHVTSSFIAIDPFHRNLTAWQKTLGLNDWYRSGPRNEVHLGSVQMLGKLQGAMIKSARPRIPTWMLELATARSADMFLITEDLPRLGNRVTVSREQQPVVTWQPNNLGAHRQLTRVTSTAMRRAGYPVILTERMGIASNSHMCGTAVAGHDGALSVLDANCRSHDVSNLWVVDGSFFPSSAALNPALTIAANALRVARSISAA